MQTLASFLLTVFAIYGIGYAAIILICIIVRAYRAHDNN